MRKIFNHLEEIIGGSLFIVMLIVLVIQIFSRQVLDSPITWTEQLARFLFVYTAYLAISSEIKNEGHVRIDFFFNKLPGSLRNIVYYVFQLMIAIVLILLIYVGYEMSLRKLPMEIVSLNISYVYMYMALPILGVLMLYRLIERNVKAIRQGKGVK
ncbi:TRAP transporter small permease [Lentibacillus cibarius]|uniref:TRAP transporter small permease n=1 Tax=Lentibacillus cibarius TaxID=2583219 RepID=UPI0015A01101|nr:TRAP transporter small permease [Lentibacillus cibarius]